MAVPTLLMGSLSGSGTGFDRYAFRVAIVLGLATTFFRIWLSFKVLPTPPLTENMRVGITLATRGCFGDPFFTPTGATAHIAPLYPILIAAAINAVGSTSLGLVVARCLLAVPLGVLVAVMPCIAHLLGFRPWVGTIAGLAFVFPSPPVFMWLEATGQHETVLTAFLFALLTAWTIHSIRTQHKTFGRIAMLGAAWGLGMHASPTLLLPMIATVFIPGWLIAQYRSELVRTATAFTLGFIIAIAPWTVRNAVTMGSPIFIRDNFGIELAMSNGPYAGPDMRENMYGLGTMTRHPYFSRDAALELLSMGEVEYYRAKQREALQWIRQNPGAFLKLTVSRIGLFFLPTLGWEHHAYFYLPVLILWIAGTLHVARRDLFIAITLNAALLAYALPHFLVQSSPRYSYPVLWIMALFAAHMVLAILERSAERGRTLLTAMR